MDGVVGSSAMRSAWPLLLLSLLVAGVLLTIDPPGGALADPPGSEPLAFERLELESLHGERVPFADLLGADGRAVCFAFLHPACPLAQDYAPVLGQLAEEFADEGKQSEPAAALPRRQPPSPRPHFDSRPVPTRRD